MKVITDHKGNVYSSITDLCKEYNITFKKFNTRRLAGWTLQECLEGKLITDYEGKIYNSITDMCKEYNTTKRLYDKLINRGFSKQIALTPSRKLRDLKLDKCPCIDFSGEEHTNEKALCEFYAIPYRDYIFYILQGIPQEIVITELMQRYKSIMHIKHSERYEYLKEKYPTIKHRVKLTGINNDNYEYLEDFSDVARIHFIDMLDKKSSKQGTDYVDVYRIFAWKQGYREEWLITDNDKVFYSEVEQRLYKELTNEECFQITPVGVKVLTMNLHYGDKPNCSLFGCDKLLLLPTSREDMGNGITKLLYTKDSLESFGVSIEEILNRLKYGWCIGNAVFTLNILLKVFDMRWNRY